MVPRNQPGSAGPGERGKLELAAGGELELELLTLENWGWASQRGKVHRGTKATLGHIRRFWHWS